MDFGYPQTTESKILQEYITQESHKLEVQVRPPMAVTNAVSWRSEGIRYRKNEVFLDVVESVNLLVRRRGLVFRLETFCTSIGADKCTRPVRTGQRQRKRRQVGDSRCGQDEVLPVGHAGAEVGVERQGHV